MVREPAVLVKGQDEESLVPLRGRAERLVDALDPALAHIDGRRRVEGHVRAAFRVDPGELGQGACFGVAVELVDGADIGLAETRHGGPAVEERVGEEAGRVGVVDPADVMFGELLEDGTLGEGRPVEVRVVGAVAVGGAGRQIGAVGVGWAGNSSEPAVEEHKVLGHGVEDGDVLEGIVVDDLAGAREVAVDAVCGDLLRDEALHVGGVEVGVWMVGAVHLLIPAGDTVVRIIRGDVLRRGLCAHHWRVGIGDIGRVAVLAVHKPVNTGAICEAAGIVVERQVLLHQNHDILDRTGQSAVGHMRRRACAKAQREENSQRQDSHGQQQQRDGDESPPGTGSSARPPDIYLRWGIMRQQMLRLVRGMFPCRK